MDDVKLRCAAARFRYRCALMERVHARSADAYHPYLAWVSSNATELVLATGVGAVLTLQGRRTSGMWAKAGFFALGAGGAYLEYAGINGARDAHLHASQRYSDLRQGLEDAIVRSKAERAPVLLRLALEKGHVGCEAIMNTASAPSTDKVWGMVKDEPEIQTLVSEVMACNSFSHSQYREWYYGAWVACDKDTKGREYLQRVLSVEERADGQTCAFHSLIYDDAHTLHHALRTCSIPTALLSGYTLTFAVPIWGLWRLFLGGMAVAGWGTTYALNRKRQRLLELASKAEVVDEQARFALLDADVVGEYRSKMKQCQSAHQEEISPVWRAAINTFKASTHCLESFTRAFD